MNPDNLPQPPEGILDPKQPWYPGKVGEKTWIILKAKLTGGEAFGTGYTSTVNLTSADADKLIENLKKDPRGYPQMDSGGGGRDFYDNLTAYQEWLREEYLEKPFRQQRDAKIEEAEIESRLSEISGEKKRKKEEEEKKKEEEEAKRKEKEEQEILDADQQAIEEEVSEITEELDTVEEKKKDTEDEVKNTPEQPEENKLSNDIESIGDALINIKGSLQTQVSDLGTINSHNTKSLSSLESLKQLFQIQTDIIKREIDLSESKRSESSLEQTTDLSDTLKSTSTMGDGKAEGIIELVDGPVLTVKTTEGEFKQGGKISQGGGGFDLMGMIKGIAGKFGGKGGGGASGGGGSPMKLSKGGIAISSPQSMAQGGFSPGVYNKPTKGNLLPGQAVIPMNRNVGKKMFGEKLTKTTRLQQPLLDVMSTPLKAIGLSILAVAGSFLRLLGPLAGFFTPYVSGLVKGFAAVLGVPVAIAGALLGGPAYAAMEDQERQQNVFAKLWASLMDKFGFSFGDDEKKGKKKGKSGDDSGPENFNGSKNAEKAFNYFKSKGMTPEQSAGIVGNLIQESGVNPNSTNPSSGNTGIAQWDPVDRWGNLVNGKTFKGKEWKGVGESGSRNLENQLRYLYWEMDSGSGGLGLARYKQQTTLEGATELFLKDFERPGAHEEVLPKRITNAKGVIREYEKTSAESGTTTSDSSMGKMLGWSIVKGPNSGYDVDPTLEMHGEEAYLQYQGGFKVLPIENNEYSLHDKPKETLTRWQEIMNPGRASIENKKDGRKQTSAAKGVTKRETLVERIFNFAKKDFKSAFFGDKPSKPALANLPASARQVMQYPKGVSTGMGGGNAGASIAPKSTARRPARSPIGNPPPKNTPEIKKVPSETDVMMEQYEALAAAGKHSEAKELGMKIWNKTWRKTNKGLERIPTTPTSATASSPATATIQPIIMTPAPSPPPPPAPTNPAGGGSTTIISGYDFREVAGILSMRRYG
jgi:hypothetical protein